MIVFGLVFLFAIYFPLDRLPPAIQYISRILPSTYTFEAMRTVLHGQAVMPMDLVLGFGLNFLYLGLALKYFKKSFQKSRELGLGRFN